MMTETRVEFRVIGQELDLDAISERLGLEPTRIWREGDPIGRTTLRRKEDAWTWSGAATDELDLEPPLLDVIGRFDSLGDQLRAIREAMGAQLLFRCNVTVADDTVPAMFLRPEIVETIASLGSAVDIDVIVSANGGS